MKVLNIEYDLMPEFRHSTCEADYSKTQKYIYETYGVIITPYDDLDIQHKGNIIVCTSPWKCKVTVFINGKNRVIDFSIDIGFICDKGSVPKLGRFYIDNDSPEWLIGFILHDILYAGHFGFSRNEADQLLKAIGLYGAMRKSDTIKPRASNASANVVYYSVYFGGRKAWKKERFELEREQKYCNAIKVCVK